MLIRYSNSDAYPRHSIFQILMFVDRNQHFVLIGILMVVVMWWCRQFSYALYWLCLKWFLKVMLLMWLWLMLVWLIFVVVLLLAISVVRMLFLMSFVLALVVFHPHPRHLHRRKCLMGLQKFKCGFAKYCFDITKWSEISFAIILMIKY